LPFVFVGLLHSDFPTISFIITQNLLVLMEWGFSQSFLDPQTCSRRPQL
jgi:hypothetical protein